MSIFFSYILHMALRGKCFGFVRVYLSYMTYTVFLLERLIFRKLTNLKNKLLQKKPYSAVRFINECTNICYFSPFSCIPKSTKNNMMFAWCILVCNRKKNWYAFIFFLWFLLYMFYFKQSYQSLKSNLVFLQRKKKITNKKIRRNCTTQCNITHIVKERYMPIWLSYIKIPFKWRWSERIFFFGFFIHACFYIQIHIML